MTGILGIRTAGRPGALKRELLLDGEPFHTSSRDVIHALGLEDGDVIDTDDLKARIAAEEPTWAHARAIRLLNHRDRSRHELMRRLSEDGYSDAAADSVLERLAQLGAIDDERFADTLVRSKVASGWGLTRVRNALRTAGIDEQLAQGALEREYPPDELKRAREIASRIIVSDAKGAMRLANRLIRRGFNPTIARTVAFETLKDDDNPLEEG